VCGESISNSLDSIDDRKVFKFMGEAGDVVGLYLSYNSASSEEPVIDLCPPSGSAPIISENRAPVVVELPETGVYDLVVRAPVVLGANDYPTIYNVGMEWVSPPEKACDAEEITFGEKNTCCVKDCLPQQTFGMTGVQGRRIEIDLESFAPTFSPSYRTEFVLLGPTGAVPVALGEAGVHVIELPMSDDYRFLLRGVQFHGSGANGSFSLTMRSLFIPIPKFRRGDVDGSGDVDLTDPISNLGFLFLGDFQPTCMDATDTDDSGIVDVSDPILSLKFQFLGGVDIPTPFPSCDIDPTEETPEDLGCDSYTCD
jgi:hypothetical protein